MTRAEEAAEKKYPVYWKNYPKDGIARSELSYDTNKQCRDAFIAGAEWQKEQMLKDAVDLNAEIEKELRLHYNDDQDVYWWNYLKNSFRHFYELGLNARKEE